MKTFFLVKVKFEKTAENGKIVKVSEVYLVDALSFTEAEQRIIKELEPFISGEFEVSSIARKKYNELIRAHRGINLIDAEANKMLKANENQSPEADRYFECKVNFITFDEDKQKDKKTPSLMLVHANSTRSANDTLTEVLLKSMADYEIEKIAETKIIDVFIYESKTI